jgi:O26-antigen biosynthesis N-acetyl-L-fucosamine transferase
MRILIIIDCYLPSYKSGAKQIHDLGVELRRQGHEVTILTTTHEIAQSFEVTTEDELRVARVKTRRIKGASKPLRGLSEMRLSAFVWRRARNFLAENPADLIVFYSPTIFWGSLVRRLKLLWRCPAYLILRDIFPEWALNTGVLRRGLIYRYFRRKEIQQYGSADVIAVQSPGDLNYFARNFAHQPYRLEVLYNWTTQHEPNLPQTHYRAELGLQNKVVFFYGGNLGVAQDVDNLVRLAASLTNHPEIRFVLVGEGSEVGGLQKAIVEQGLHNVQLLPAIEQRRYIAMVSEFDVGLITLDRRLTNHNIPGKLLGYLYWGIPVLASINPENDMFDLLGKSDAGFCFANGEDDNLRDATLQLATDAQLRAQMGKNGRRLLEEIFSVEAAARQILQRLPGTPRQLEREEVLTAHS